MLKSMMWAWVDPAKKIFWGVKSAKAMVIKVIFWGPLAHLNSPMVVNIKVMR